MLNAAVTAAPGHALDDDDGFQISIAGAQEKTALTWHDGRWCKPRGATPTTHIFKLPLGLVGHRQADMRTSVENEWLCARLVGAYGLPIARCEIGRFGMQKPLAVERFDRKLAPSGSYWLRLPQEDFCQALGALRGKNTHYRLKDIQRRHFNATAKVCGLGEDMDAHIEDVFARTSHVIEQAGVSLPQGFPGDLFESVTGGLATSARRLGAMLA